jgi:D-alanyl-D-alanine carboxypeptidase
MRSAIPHTRRTYTHVKLTALAVACALLSAAGSFSAATASASTGAGHESGIALQAALRHDLRSYLTSRRKAEHISAVSLRITFRGGKPAINLATGTTRYDGGPPVSTSALWQIGSNTKAFTAVILLQLEAEGKLSIDDQLGKWLPQYPAWRHITITQLLNMTSGIADYAAEPAFVDAIAANPSTRFSEARLVSYAVGVPLSPAGWSYSDTNYILAQMIIERVTKRTFAEELTSRIIRPLGLHDTCDAPYTCPAADAVRMPTGYFYRPVVPALMGKSMPPLALTWAQGAGGIVSSLRDMTTWDRALYQGRELPARQQRQLERLVSQVTGKPIRTTTPTDPGFGLGVFQITTPSTGTAWYYEGGTLGYRVVHFYFPRSGIAVALAVNSYTDPNTNDDLQATAFAVYDTLVKAGAAPSAS